MILLTASILSLHPLWAQADKPVVIVSPFTIEGIGAEEARIIETLIQSYITALGDVVNYQIVLPAGQEAAGSIPDYTFSGSITLDQDSRILMLEIGNTRTGETVSYTSTHRTTGELVLKARALVESAFSVENSGSTLGQRNTPEPELLTEQRIAGNWRGDTGIEMIRLLRGGRGIAFFSSGAQMNLLYVIEGNTLKIVQSSPNTERYYHPVPYGVATQLVTDAEPMRWELLLYDNGTALKGIKVATGVLYEGDRILELFPGSARDAEWIKASH
ncbi:hypothetical protein FACS189483_07680 [Spirochaetia bacterium]|nr:hypothetical protein FACS189483_07680 [Spirochaetia bacterium]